MPLLRLLTSVFVVALASCSSVHSPTLCAAKSGPTFKAPPGAGSSLDPAYVAIDAGQCYPLLRTHPGWVQVKVGKAALWAERGLFVRR